MELPLVSVIVPVFKVEKYLDKCLQSLLAQTYQNCEIVLINDGSPDRCGEICNQYAKKSHKVKYYYKENGGLSDARNYGVDKAQGDWIVFVDSDDYVTADYVEYLISIKNKFRADAACAKIRQVCSDQAPTERYEQTKTFNLSTVETLKRMLYAKELSVSACCKLFPKSLLLEHPFPVGKLYEDLFTTYRIVDECKNIAYGTKQIYFYRRRGESIMHGKVSEKNIQDAFDAARSVVDYMEEKHPEILPAAHSRYVRKAFDFMPQILNGTIQDKLIYRKIKEEMTPHYRIVMQDKEAPWSVKLRSTSVMCGYNLSVALWRIYDSLNAIKSAAFEKDV